MIFQVYAGKVERKQLQLVGVAAMFIASKYEEMYAPEIGDFVYITDRAYTESQIREMEMRILDTLGFDLQRPLRRVGPQAKNLIQQLLQVRKYPTKITWKKFVKLKHS